MDQGDAAPSRVGAPVTSLHAAPAEPYRSARRVATVVIAFLTVHIVFDIVAAAVDVQMLGLLTRIRDGAAVTFEEAQAHDDRMYWSGILQDGAALLVLVPFVVWLRRVYRNLGPLGTRSLRFKPGWAVGGWFVPFLNLARPKSIVNDVWRGSDPELPREMIEPPEGARVPAYVNWWWGTLLASRAIYPTPVPRRVPTVEEMVVDVQRVLVGDVLLVVAGILAIVTVHKTTQRQEQRRARLAQDTGAAVV
ncbi:MAG: DUF4328 domain-containing protein [Actinomycetota bacterium]|nr:DUF4328 domain-containing protein [Actinomycetota bacterium]